MSDSFQIHNGLGDNVNGDKNIISLSVNMDVGRLSEILQTNAEKIKVLFAKVEKKSTVSKIEIDERTIPIDKKNNINGLAEFYNEFIKKHEGKLLALDNFFKENDFMTKIESAANHLKIHIFAKDNRKQNTLDTAIFNEIIQDHNKAVVDSEDKDIMTLLLFYLYRFCYIGDKNGI